MASPYYQIIDSSGEDVTKYFESFDFEESIEKDNILTLPMKNPDLSVVDSDSFQRGSILTFQFGFLSGKLSSKREAEITKVDCTYGGVVSLTIKARDKGNSLKKLTSSRIFKEVKISDIVKTIASEYNLESEIDDTSKTYEKKSQGNKSYYEFLKKLAEEATLEGEPFQFFIQDNILHFQKRKLDKEPITSFKYKSDEFVSLTIETSSNDDLTGSSVGTSNIDDESGEIFSFNSDEITKEETSTGDLKMTYDVDGNLIKKDVDQGNDTGRKSFSPGKRENAVSKIVKEHTDSSLNEVTATLRVVGDPHLKSDELITLSGFAESHSGNWYVVSVRHTINGSGYICVLKLNRNGGKLSSVSTKTNQSVNKATGPDQIDDSVEMKVHNYSVDGVEQ